MTEDKKTINNKDLEKITGGASEDLGEQIKDALNEATTPNPKTDQIKNKWNL